MISEPNYNAPLLRFHLFKIAYKPKHELIWEHNLTYALEHNQSYDVVYKKSSQKKSSQKNPLLIYVHGGGWRSGDKESFHAVSAQYADKGFTVATLNYRLLHIPKVGFKEMVDDVGRGIKHIMDEAKKYHADTNNTIIIADSAGAQLSYMAMSKFPSKYKIKKVVFNSIPADFKLFSKEKLEKLSGFSDINKTEQWIGNFSPFNHLMTYKPSTLCISGFKDKLVPKQHLENLEIQSVINFNNISSFWIENANHSVIPNHFSLTPSYQEIEFKIDAFIQ